MSGLAPQQGSDGVPTLALAALDSCLIVLVYVDVVSCISDKVTVGCVVTT